MSSQWKRGHHKPLLTCQAIFISLSNCAVVWLSMSFTIHSLKIVEKTNYTHKNLESEIRRKKTIMITERICAIGCQLE